MSTFLRLLITLCVVCITMQGTFAHEHGAPSARVAMASESASASVQLHSGVSHCAANSRQHDCAHGHDRCPCCMTSCGVHRGALLAVFAFEPHSSTSAQPRPRPDAPLDGVIPAPLLRPPIG